MRIIDSEMTIAQKIKAIRVKRGYTQEKLGKLAGINEGNLRKYESGTIPNPTIKTLEKIAQALDVPIYFFISSGSESLVKEWDEKIRQFLNDENVTLNPDIEPIIPLVTNTSYTDKSDVTAALRKGAKDKLDTLNNLGVSRAYDYIGYLANNPENTEPDK